MTFYIPQFWCGVIWTVLVEVGILIAAVVYTSVKSKGGEQK